MVALQRPKIGRLLTDEHWEITETSQCLGGMATVALFFIHGVGGWVGHGESMARPMQTF